jgi:hypothetical protein
MQSEIRSPIALLTDTNVTICFQHRLFYITRRQSLVHTIQLDNTHLQESLFLFFLIVHHKESFPSPQHKVICKLSLTIVCGSPFLFLAFKRWPVRFARPPHANKCFIRVFHLLYSILVLTTGLSSRHTRRCKRRSGI